MNLYISLEALAKVCVIITSLYILYMTIMVGGFRHGKKEISETAVRIAVILIFTGPIAAIYLACYIFMCI